ncbi:helix-turn-helix domain-containing protein [Tsukamurella conjunctivitidis]|uniref:Helix-turn-helix domain-containing protein n=1 Tax=Tsukamurella conjunctivitidis TaxID=2592068 RepID=A0A5C5S4P5_9ACTN|nr:helix-turn-helix domain-containing protein [Tsukamurella conjunctivitidis]TWS29271.1 helix-turn-helix domain-containing protein [Tsukamurella conjunctivitidis]
MNDHADVSARLKVSRSTVFALWKSGQLGSVKIGKRRFSTDRQITEYVARLEAGAA